MLRYVFEEHVEEASVAAVLDDASMGEDLHLRAVVANERETDIGIDVGAVCIDLSPDARLYRILLGWGDEVSER